MLELNIEEVRPQAPLSVQAPDAPAATAGLSRAAVYLRVLEEMDYGLLVVDGAGAFRSGNRLGLRELVSGPLQLSQGRVHARAAADQSRFAAALHDAMRGLRRLIGVGQNGAGVSISVVPIPGGVDDGVAEPLALLTFGKRPGDETLSVDFYARAHGLTGAEQTVLKEMWRGRKPADIARQQGVAICTVRSHICNIRLKTQTGSIRELLGRLAALPPIMPAVTCGGLTLHEAAMVGLVN